MEATCLTCWLERSEKVIGTPSAHAFRLGAYLGRGSHYEDLALRAEGSTENCLGCQSHPEFDLVRACKFFSLKLRVAVFIMIPDGYFWLSLTFEVGRLWLSSNAVLYPCLEY